MSNAVICELCPRNCNIPDGGAGDCRIRVNLSGTLTATTFGRPSAVHIDPMEKKPLYHFLPGQPVFSIGTAGCNLHCLNCQNWQLSQRGGEEMEEIYRLEPTDLVQIARNKGCRAVAYTYNEPIVYYEYVEEAGQLVHRQGLRNVFVTAAYINREPLRRLCKVLDACNADLKAFDDRFYHEVTGASLKPVLDALVTLREEGVWLEVTNLVIPTLNDDLSMIRAMVRWIVTNLGSDTPLHFSRFHPMYRMRNLPATPAEILRRARNEALDAGLKYVYIGNLFDAEGATTFCPNDHTPVIRRTGVWLEENRLDSEGRCPTCREHIPGVWQ